MNSIFAWVLISSAMGSLLAVIILLVKRLLKNRLTPTLHYYIWFLLLIRLVLPYAPQNPFSLYSLFTPEVNSISLSYNLNQQNYAKQTKPNMSSGKTAENNDTSSEYKSYNYGNKSFSWSHILFIIWLLGFIISIGYILISNLIFKSKMKYSIPIKNKAVENIRDDCLSVMNIKGTLPIVYSEYIRTPSLYGLIDTKIILPINILDKLMSREIKYILLHELCHYKRKDILVNWIVLVLRCIHWFNPLIWYSFYKISEDCEISCDYRVLSSIDEGEHGNYGYTIISLLNMFSKEHPFGPAAPGMLKDSKYLEKRIKMISSFKRRSHKVLLTSIVIIVLLGVFSLTNARGMADNKNKKTPIKPPSVSSVSNSANTNSSDDESMPKVDLSKLKIILPEGWKQYGDSNQINFKDENGTDIGGVEVVGYYGGDLRSTLPNHSSVGSRENINTTLGTGELFLLNRDNPAASSIHKNWKELHAIIPVKDESMAYDFHININTSEARSMSILMTILKHIN